MSGDGSVVVPDVSQRTPGVFGVKGAGKTNTLAVMADELAAQDARYVLIDPIGAFANKQRDGERTPPTNEAYLHTELEEDNGAAIADLLFHPELKHVSLLLDLSHMTQVERVKFSDGFCERVLQKKNDRSELIVLADEVHELCPGRVGRGEAMSSGQFIRLCTMGRNKGVGVVVASQRLNKVHADVRELIDYFVFHKIIYSITLDACRDLLKHHVRDKDELNSILARIQGLAVGEAFIFDPSSINPDRTGGEPTTTEPVQEIAQVRRLDEKATGEVEPPARPAAAAPQPEPVAVGKAMRPSVNGHGAAGAYCAETLEIVQRLHQLDADAAAVLAVEWWRQHHPRCDVCPGMPTVLRVQPRGKSDADGKRWTAKIIEAEPAAAQTSMTKAGRAGDTVYIDDDFRPEDLHGLTVHEATEEMGMRAGLSQQQAHTVANAAERVAAGDYQFEAETERAQEIAEKARRETGMGKGAPPAEVCDYCGVAIPSVSERGYVVRFCRACLPRYWARADQARRESERTFGEGKHKSRLTLGPENGRSHEPDLTDITRLASVDETYRVAGKADPETHGKAYQNVFPDIEPEVIELVQRFVESHPWRGTVEEQNLRAIALLRELEQFYDLPQHDLIIDTRIQHSGMITYANLQIVLPKMSLVTLLHEFRHAVQFRQRPTLRTGEGPNPAPTGNPETDRMEEDARAWSLSLYSRAAPIHFERGVRRGIILFMEPLDVEVTTDYVSFAELSRHEPETAYRVESNDRPGRYLIHSPHGGKIEFHTTELTRAVAGDDTAWYSFQGLKQRDNKVLHISSRFFDEPTSQALVAAHETIVTIHGFSGETGVDKAIVGGRDAELGERLIDAINAAGFPAEIASERLVAAHPDNVTNKGTSGMGVQLELSANLRTRLREDAALTRRFADAVRAGLGLGPSETPPPAPPVESAGDAIAAARASIEQNREPLTGGKAGPWSLEASWEAYANPGTVDVNEVLS